MVSLLEEVWRRSPTRPLEKERTIKSISLELLHSDYDALVVQGVSYKWGSKVRPSTPFEEIHELDCSGLFQWLLSMQEITVPEGSWEQLDFCKRSGLPLILDYRKVINGRGLYACFAIQEGKRPGHVWIVRQGETIECHGGGGCSPRAAETGTLQRIFHAAFELPYK